MKILATVLLTLLSTAMPTVLAADKKNVRGQQSRQLQTTFCGCNDCTLSVWNTAAERFDGDHTCGERITWVNHNMGVSEEDACVSVAGEFPTVCGKACHPYRCDGRQVPYEVADEEFPVQAGDLTPETELYCYPPAAQRQRWTGVWGNDFIMEAKETVNSGFVTCDPGSNYFTTDRIAFDGQELTFELARDAATGRWMGAEVRLVLPDAAFSYGAYEWSVPTIRIVDTRDGSVVPGPLPPGLVLGLFTWDSTEDFALRENRNHEVDVSIHQGANLLWMLNQSSRSSPLFLLCGYRPLGGNLCLWRCRRTRCELFGAASGGAAAGQALQWRDRGSVRSVGPLVQI
jgi:hypothetical protein